MAEAVDQITEVETKTLPTGTVIYVIKDTQGREYSTKDRDIAHEAYGAVGQHAHFDYTEKKGGQFGQYTNRFLNAFALLPDEGQIPPSPQTQFPGPIPTIAGPPPFAGSAPPDGGDPFIDTQPELPTPAMSAALKDRNIARSVALKAAVDLMEYFEPDQRSSTNVTGVAEYFEDWLLR